MSRRPPACWPGDYAQAYAAVQKAFAAPPRGEYTVEGYFTAAEVPQPQGLQSAEAAAAGAAPRRRSS